METITIKSLSYFAKHGFYEKERTDGNRFEVDLIAKGEFKKAIGNDLLSETFDYEKAEQVVSSVMQGPPEKLIETLCSKIGSELISQFHTVKALTVKVRKLDPPLIAKAEFAEIKMQWKR